MSELKTSMPTNEERREVAARLREDGSLRNFAEVFDIDRDTDNDWTWGSDVASRIADLIEPTERTCYMNEYDVEGYTVPESICGDGFCSGCDGVIAVEDRYCPHCGAKVV